jgi:hypothetical protein
LSFCHFKQLKCQINGSIETFFVLWHEILLSQGLF